MTGILIASNCSFLFAFLVCERELITSIIYARNAREQEGGRNGT